MRELLKNRRYKTALLNVNQKINEGIFKSDYQKKLNDLIPHLSIESVEDKKRREFLLMNAITSPDASYESIKKILDTGSALLLNNYNTEYGPFLFWKH